MYKQMLLFPKYGLKVGDKVHYPGYRILQSGWTTIKKIENPPKITGDVVIYGINTSCSIILSRYILGVFEK